MMPKINSMVTTPDGTGKVMYLDLIKKKVSVKFQSEQSTEIKVYDCGQLKFKKED